MRIKKFLDLFLLFLCLDTNNIYFVVESLKKQTNRKLNKSHDFRIKLSTTKNVSL